MKKGYWVVQYRDDSDVASINAYGEIAVPLVKAAGGRVLLGSVPAEAPEDGMLKRTVVVEFPNLQKALDLYHSPEYGKALKVLGTGSQRDFRILEGIEGSE